MRNALKWQAPPHTLGTFSVDHSGAIGWWVQMPDAAIERIYFQLSDQSGTASVMSLGDTPISHDGVRITDTSIANIGGIYIKTLARIV